METIKIKSNIHAHTKYCNHSSLEPELLIIWAKKNQFKEFTISEHIPYPQYEGNRTHFDEWEKIIKEFKELKQKYSTNDFKVYISIESEYYKKDKKFYKDFIEKNNLDFAILGNHDYKSGMIKPNPYNEVFECPYKMTKAYVKQAISGMKSKLFIHLAHPDLILKDTKIWDEKIEKEYIKLIKCAQKYNISLGFNINGFASKKSNNQFNEYQFPSKYFWNLVAKYDVKVRVELDCHSNKALNPILINETYKYMKSFNLEKNFIDDIHSSLKK